MLKESTLPRYVQQAPRPYASDTRGAEGLPVALDFFAGSGLVTAGLKPYFQVAWANDICEKKAAVYLANHPGDGFVVAPIEQIRGAVLPAATLSWGSFPCQDLSLAGNLQGIQSSRSGLVWHWLRVMDEMCATPPLVVAENVVGLVSADNGEHYRQLHQSLVARGYRVGAVVVDAAYWIPQSRPRIFVIGVNDQVDISEFEDDMPGWAHPAPLQRAARGLEGWVWWRLPAPRSARKPLEDLIDFAADCDGAEKREHNLKLINPQHRQKMQRYAEAGFRVFPGYKRTRNGRQVLELRFDGLAGCLRTPEGGSSRQLLVLWREGKFETRLLTIREVALLMGAKSSYQLPGSYNEAYKAMGDAVAVPVVSHLSRHILAPIAAKLTCD